jgi:hypothetical protein
MTTETKAMVPFAEIQSMAVAAVKSGLFPGVKTPEAAVTLMLVAQAEGLHPIQALQRYNVIDGKPSKTAESMLASFQEHGGRLTWRLTTDTECEAVFESPGMGSPLTVRWSMDDARRAGLDGKQNWKKYPRAMLRARVVSEGVRASLPGVVLGMYTPEEVADFGPAPREVTPPPADATYTPPPAVAMANSVLARPVEAPKATGEAEAARSLARDVVKRLMPTASNADRRAWCAKVLGRDPSAYELTVEECHAIMDAAEAEDASKREVA